MAKACNFLRFGGAGMGSLAALALAFAACSDGADVTSTAVGTADGGTDVAARPDASDPRRDGGEEDASARTICAITRAYYEGCGNEADLNCGSAGFDAWCAANDEAINSATYRAAEVLCLDGDHCDGADRRDCEYGHYADVPPTAAQVALVGAYCTQCSPGDVEGCKVSSTTYDRAKGIESVPDVFVAAWELSDVLVEEITTTCLGKGAADASEDPLSCAKTFGSCAAGIYLDRIPECTK